MLSLLLILISKSLGGGGGGGVSYTLVYWCCVCMYTFYGVFVALPIS
jgi:hypothetical protein